MSSKYQRMDFQSIDTTPTQATNYASTNDPNILRNPKFLGDLRDYYQSKGIGRQTDEELIDRFYSDNTWQDFNTVSAVKGAGEALTADREQKPE